MPKQIIKSICLAALFVLLVGSTANAQDFELGKPSDLKGLSKVFINTNGDLAEMERITTRIKKAKLPNLATVEDLAEAEIILVFGGGEFTADTGVTHNRQGNMTYSTINRVPLLAGEGRVYVANRDGSKPLLIMRVANEQNSRLEKRPVTKFVNQFLKIWQAANPVADEK